MNRTMTALATIAAGAVIVPAIGNAADISNDDVLVLVRRHCGACHAARPTHQAFTETPKGVVLETAADLRKHAEAIAAQTVDGRAMPLGNETGMTDADRATLGRWLKAQR